MKIINRFLLGTAATAAIFSAAIPSSAQTYTFHFKPNPGKTTYRMKMDTEATGSQSMKMKMDMTMSMTASNLAHGQHKILVKFGKVAMTMNGQEMPAQSTDSFKKMTMTMVMDANGKTIKSSGTGAAAGMSSMMQGFTNVSFYGKPLKVGKKFPVSGGTMGANMKGTYELVSVRTVHGRRLATFVVDKLDAGPTAKFTFMGKPTTVLDADTGMLVSVSMHMLTEANGSKADMKIAMSELR